MVVITALSNTAFGNTKPAAKQRALQAFNQYSGPTELNVVPWQQLEQQSIALPIVLPKSGALFDGLRQTIQRSDIQHDLRNGSKNATPTSQ